MSGLLNGLLHSHSLIVLFATVMLGIAAGACGTFALLKGRALVSDAVAHCTLPGLVLAFLIAELYGLNSRELSYLLLGAASSAVLGIECIRLLTRHTRLSLDAAIGSVLSVFFGLGIVLLSVVQARRSGREAGLHHFIYGQSAVITTLDAAILLGVTLSVLIFILLTFKELTLSSFDRTLATTMGYPIERLELLFSLALTSVIVAGLQAVGLLLVVALLIVPAVTARLISERIRNVLILACIMGGLSAFLGTALSLSLPAAPTGAAIVICAGALFILTLIVAPKRGLMARFMRSLNYRVRVAEEHYFRHAYERSERQQNSDLKLPFSLVSLILYLRWLRRGLVRESLGSLKLTEKGEQHALKLTRNHRIWEAYLNSEFSIDAHHLDLSADLVEHSLSPEITSKLEEKLKERGLLPSKQPIPPSLHSIEG